MTTLIKNAHIVTQNARREILKGDILVKDGKIAAIGKVTDSADQEIDAKGDVVMPGLINTHSHVAMATMKAVADDVTFPNFLDRVFALDSRRTEKDIKSGAALGCLEMIRSGTTSFVDLYYSEDVIGKVVEQAGLRGLLCWAVLDVEYTTQKGIPLDNCKRFCEQFKDSKRVIPGIGLQGVYVCSTETFVSSNEYSEASGRRMTFHLSETRKEVYDHKKKEGLRPAEYLGKIGVLNERCIAAHSAWLTINEVKILGRQKVSVSTCPVSNMKLATGGVAPIPEMLQNEVNVSIGTDGCTTNNGLDMFGEMKTLSLLQKASRWDPTVLPSQQVLDFATLGGAKALGLSDQIGSLEVGKRADLVILDGRSPSLRPMLPENIVSNIVYSAGRGDVKTVICDGRVVMLDRMVKSLDEEKILDESEGAIRALLS
ncbi:MAG: amidohydrolase family protein [Methanomassiliicoccales archaeon]|jgi:5-methylthioadenosine/S-adenosylhomocysteine deaminase